MVSLPIYNRSGAEVGQYEIDPEALAPKISQQLLHDVVVMYQANARQGTHRTKDRSDVAGTTKKMYRQKGTGNARAGSRRAPQRRGGYHVFALRPRDYSYACRARRKPPRGWRSPASRSQRRCGDRRPGVQRAEAEMAGILKAESRRYQHASNDGSRSERL
jgi:hypothetical protein